jgi:peptide deformylase
MFLRESHMSYKLVYYGNETLRKVADEVKNIDGDLIRLIDTMYNIMYQSGGIGLAAPQIEVGKRILVLDIREKMGPMLELINPVIKEVSVATEPYEEGCLSVPGINHDVIRPTEILVSGVGRDGKVIELEADGLLARVLQHEIDHLNGILFIDRIEDYVRSEYRGQLKKIKKMNKEE